MTDTAKSPLPGAAAGRLPLFNVVGFTGHRHLADPGGASLAIREALALLVREVPGEWIALSSIARGGDQLFVSEARAAGMSWHCILPLARPEFARDFAPEEWASVEATLESADHLRTIHEYGDREDSYLDCVDRRGVVTPRSLAEQTLSAPSLAPDGQRAAVIVADTTSRDLWIVEPRAGHPESADGRHGSLARSLVTRRSGTHDRDG